jgi:hypothetical protein
MAEVLSRDWQAGDSGFDFIETNLNVGSQIVRQVGVFVGEPHSFVPVMELFDGWLTIEGDQRLQLPFQVAAERRDSCGHGVFFRGSIGNSISERPTGKSFFGSLGYRHPRSQSW